MRGLLGASLILFGALAACVETGERQDALVDRTVTVVQPSGVPSENRTQNQFYFVTISGSETAERVRGSHSFGVGHCDAAWSFSYDRAQEAIRYDAERFPIDADSLVVLVAAEYRGVEITEDGVYSGCAGVTDLRGFDGRARYATTVREGLPIEVVVEALDGFISYNRSYFARMGEKVHAHIERYVTAGENTYKVTGDFEVANLGAWPRTAVVVEAG